MINDYTVDVLVKDKDSNNLIEKSFELNKYCNMLSKNMYRILLNVLTSFNTTQNKDTDLYKKIRHDVLDVANSINRLPNNIRFKGQKIDSIKLSDLIAQIITE